MELVQRDPFKNTLLVWKAIFLKDALKRFFGSRGAWAWLLVEPSINILVFAFLYSIIRSSHFGGVPMQSWIMVGMLGFFLFRRTSVQVLHSIDCNKAFFAFRQVRPFDAAFSCALVEAFAMFWVAVIIITFFNLVGYSVWATNFLVVMLGMLGLWLLGLGYGLISSVCMRLVPDSGHILQLLMMPLYFVSGVIFPTTRIPFPYREYIMWNPILHGVEGIRYGFWDDYHGVEVNLAYLYFWVLVFLVIGLALYRVLETRLVRQ